MQCETYDNLWTWDLSLSCDNVTMQDCNCTFADQLMSAGLLNCSMVEDCPEDCAICSTCLVLLGCEDVSQGNDSLRQRLTTSRMLWIIGASVVSLIFGLAYYHQQRRNRKLAEGGLKEGLIAAGGGADGDFLKPVADGKNKLPFKSPQDPAAQFAPSTNTALAAGLKGAILSGNRRDAPDDEVSQDGTMLTFDESIMADTAADDESTVFSGTVFSAAYSAATIPTIDEAKTDEIDESSTAPDETGNVTTPTVDQTETQTGDEGTAAVVSSTGDKDAASTPSDNPDAVLAAATAAVIAAAAAAATYSSQDAPDADTRKQRKLEGLGEGQVFDALESYPSLEQPNQEDGSALVALDEDEADLKESLQRIAERIEKNPSS
jgi:hypothetical protein